MVALMMQWQHLISWRDRKKVSVLKKKLDKLLKKTIFNDIFVMEIVFFIGIFIIAYTNFKINLYFGLYFVGAILIAFSIFLYKFTGKRGENK
jgi:hypothetical protein